MKKFLIQLGFNPFDPLLGFLGNNIRKLKTFRIHTVGGVLLKVTLIVPFFKKCVGSVGNSPKSDFLENLKIALIVLLLKVPFDPSLCK